jgi:transcriptional regulator with XRE-family HTH domain
MSKSKSKSKSTESKPARLRANLSPGQMLKTLRKLQGMTQENLAEASGLDQSVISAMEHGRTAIGEKRAIKLAKTLRVHPAVILFSSWDENADSESAEESREESDEPTATLVHHVREFEVA